jgi:hypothetical protein
MIKYNIKTVNDWLYNSNPIKGMYYNGRRVYRRFVANGQPTPPTPPAFEGKWKATYSDSHIESAQCDSSSAIVNGEIDLTNLVSVEIGDYCVTSIGMWAFEDCISLTSCTIGSGVTSIGQYAFYSCSGLTSITVNATTPPTLGNNAFQGTPIASGTGYIYVKSASVDVYKQANGWKTFATQIMEIPT